MVWRPLLSALPVACVTLVLSVVAAIGAALQVRLPASGRGRFTWLRLCALLSMLHLLQPLARLWSRLAYSLTARKIRRFPTLSFPWPRMFQFWSEECVDATELLLSLESVLRSSGAVVRRGGDYDSWDLEIRGGLFGGVRVRTVSANYGRRKEMVWICSGPWFSFLGQGL